MTTESSPESPQFVNAHDLLGQAYESQHDIHRMADKIGELIMNHELDPDVALQAYEQAEAARQLADTNVGKLEDHSMAWVSGFIENARAKAEIETPEPSRKGYRRATRAADNTAPVKAVELQEETQDSPEDSTVYPETEKRQFTDEELQKLSSVDYKWFEHFALLHGVVRAKQIMRLPVSDHDYAYDRSGLPYAQRDEEVSKEYRRQYIGPKPSQSGKYEHNGEQLTYDQLRKQVGPVRANMAFQRAVTEQDYENEQAFYAERKKKTIHELNVNADKSVDSEDRAERKEQGKLSRIRLIGGTALSKTATLSLKTASAVKRRAIEVKGGTVFSRKDPRYKDTLEGKLEARARKAINRVREQKNTDSATVANNDTLSQKLERRFAERWDAAANDRETRRREIASTKPVRATKAFVRKFRPATNPESDAVTEGKREKVSVS